MNLNKLRHPGHYLPPAPQLSEPRYEYGGWQPPLMDAPDSMSRSDVIEWMHRYAALERRRIDAIYRGEWLRVAPRSDLYQHESLGWVADYKLDAKAKSR